MSMTIEEFRKEYMELESNFAEKKKEIYKKFALANNKYKIGEIIEDHICVGRIIRIAFFMNTLLSDKPCECRYICERLRKKDLQPVKNGEKVDIYQSNVRKKW